MDESLKHHNPNPVAKANPISKIFFWWLNPLFKKGYVRQLEVEDMYNVVQEDQSDYLGQRLETEWLKEVEKTKSTDKKPSLFKAMFRIFGLEYMLLGIILFLEEATKVIQPLLLGGLIRYFTPNSKVSETEAYLYAAGVSFCAVILAVAHHPYFFAVQRIGMKMRIACCSLLYRKSLRLSNAGLSKTTTGQIVNLMSNDVNRFDQAVIFLHFLWIGPLEAIAVLAILWRELGPSTLAGFAVLLFLVPVQGWMGKLFSKFRQKTAKHTDERVRVMNEIISGMRVIKMYCWEKPFGDLVAKIRREESKKICTLGYLRGFILGPFFVSVKLICLVVFVSFVLSGGQLRAELVFVAISLYTALRLATVLFMPFAVQFISETKISFKRIQTIASTTTADPYNVSALIGDDSTSLPDDIIQMAMNLIKVFSPTHHQDYIGYYTLAELVLYTRLKEDLIPKPVIPSEQFSVNIHPLYNHWVTSCQYPDLNEIHVFDSLMNKEHLEQVTPQIRLLYGDSAVNRMIYKPVTQQSTSPICGVMAIAFAFSCFLGMSCESKYDIKKARDHLRQCMLSQTIQQFPLHKDNVQALTTECRIDNYLKDQKSKGTHHELQRKKREYKESLLNEINLSLSEKKHCELQRKSKEREKKRQARLIPGNRKRELEQRKKARCNPDKIKREMVQKQKYRTNQDNRIRELEQRKKARCNSDKIKREMVQKQKYRTNPDNRIRELEQRKKARCNPDKIKREMVQKQKNRTNSDNRIRELEQRKKARCNPDKIKREMVQKQKNRTNPDNRIRELEQRKKARCNPDKIKREMVQKQKNRTNPDNRIRELEQRKKARCNPDKIKREMVQKQKNRTNPDNRIRELEQRKKARCNPDKIKKEMVQKQKNRTNPDNRVRELEQRKKARCNPDKIKREMVQKQKNRTNPDNRVRELEQKKKARCNPDYRKHEQMMKRSARTDHLKRVHEILMKRKARSNPVKRKAERNQKRNSRKRLLKTIKTISIEDLISSFKLSVSSSCDYECTCCAQLFFKQSVVKFPKTLALTSTLQKCKTGTCSVQNKEWICHTCLSYLKKNKIPPLSKLNGMSFPHRPDILNLNKLEERLISPLNVFMQMRELPSGRQVSVRGNVVNVPADSISTVKTLPRRPEQSDTVPVKLKRRLRYKTHYMYENVRPQMCIDATKHLLNKTLFKNFVYEGFDTEWLQTWEKSPMSEFLDSSHTITEERDKDGETINEPQTSADSHEMNNVVSPVLENEDDSDTWSEDGDDNFPSGEIDTMMFPTFTDEYDGQQVVSVAPSEGNVPTSLFSDNIEELAYPTIFCGDKRPKNSERYVPVKYSEICKSELRSSDRRCSMNITNLFFKTRKVQLKQIQDKVSLSLRRKQLKGRTFTAKDMKDKQVVDNMVCLDEGFRIFRTLRGSPPYWENAKRDIFAMLRQCGLPTWFISLSAAETHWKPLLKTLGKIIDHKDYTDDEIDAFLWDTKSRLIKSDPVTVARYFDYRIQQFFHVFLFSSVNPLGKIVDFWYHVEFQQRGSPHIHGLLWVEDAPKYQEHDNKQIEDFISKHIATDSSFDPLVNYQKHRHSHTCKKKGKKQCRFNFPLPPSCSTKLLDPLVLSSGDNEEELENATKNWVYIQAHMEEICSTPEITFPEFLQHLKMNEEDYINAIRSSLIDTKVLLKREPCDIRINGYNKGILKAWEANHDIQFVTDAYACAMYIVSYISKGQRGMSDLLRRACEDARKGGSDIRSQVREIGNKFTKHVEISAQEAAYITLQLPMRRSSRSFLFINTSPPDERPFLVKDIEQLKLLPENSEEIQCENVISRYARRDPSLESLCLADFAANYDVVYNKRQHKNKSQTELPESDIEQSLGDDPVQDQQDNSKVIKLKDGTKLRKRRKPKVIRYVNYAVKQDSENYYREKLMLFFPWRQESNLMDTNPTYEEMYMIHKEQIEDMIKMYAPLLNTINDAEEMLLEQDNNSDQIIAPITQHQEDIDMSNNANDLEDRNENLFTDYDIGHDIGISSSLGMEESIRNRVTDVEYRQDVRSLNEKQYELFLHVLKTVKTEDSQFFLFITGGAGVGKTKLTKTLYQALLRHYNTGIGSDPEGKSVILTAPTGKAAYLIGGTTIHSTFCIPANQNLQHKPLNSSSLNTLRMKLSDLRIVFIDEVSMCGANMFNFINLRLQEVKRTTKPFGGVSVICIGDLFQLHPVMDRWIFHMSSTNYSVLAPNIWIDNMKLFELTEIMRQANDKCFAQALNNIREGLHTQKDIDLLSLRILTETQAEDYPISATHILYYNKSVQSHNSALFDRSVCQKAINKAVDIVIGDVLPDVKTRILEKAPILPGDSMGLPMLYRSAVELRNELTLNLDVEDGLVNGAGGVCRHFTITAGSKLKIVWIHFDDPKIGLQLRRNSGRLYERSICKDWTPITPVKRKFPVGRYKNVSIQRDQFPLNLTCAKTIHKCQGDTLKDVVVQLPREKRPHVHYVALSRVTTLEKLHILQPFDPLKITVSADVQLEMERLRTHCQVHLCYTPLYSLPSNYFVVCFHNAQSVNLHLEDIKSERNFLRADILILTETKLCKHDIIDIPGRVLYRNDFSAQRTPYGSLVVSKAQHQICVEGASAAQVEMTLISVLQPVSINILGVYRPPNHRWKPFQNALEIKLKTFCRHEKVIVIGDFNTDTTTFHQLCLLMQNYKFTQIVKGVTTNNNTKIDLIFVNFESYKGVGEIESYYSHHKPVWVAL